MQKLADEIKKIEDELARVMITLKETTDKENQLKKDLGETTKKKNDLIEKEKSLNESLECKKEEHMRVLKEEEEKREALKRKREIEQELQELKQKYPESENASNLVEEHDFDLQPRLKISRLDDVLLNTNKDRHNELLFDATFNGQLVDLQYFIEEGGLPISAKTATGESLLHLATRGGSRDAIQYLIKRGSKMALDYNEMGTLLLSASFNGKLEVIQYLCRQRDVDISYKEMRSKATALHLASERGELDVIKYLVKRGANLRVKDRYESTPLHHASRFGQLKVIKYFAKQDLDLDVQDIYGGTPLHDASRFGRLEAVKELRRLGADPTVANNNKFLPIDVACWERPKDRRQMYAIVAYLKQH